MRSAGVLPMNSQVNVDSSLMVSLAASRSAPPLQNSAPGHMSVDSQMGSAPAQSRKAPSCSSAAFSPPRGGVALLMRAASLRRICSCSRAR